MKRLIACMITLLALSGCGTVVPQFPEVWRCTYSVRFSKFRCRNSVTNVSENRSLTDPRMENAEALSAQDSLAVQSWIDTVIEIAKQRCH